LKVTKLNVDDHPATASRYGIRGIPNLIILKAGAVKEQIVGAVPKAKLVSAIEKALQ
jgi:thioredoxin 1